MCIRDSHRLVHARTSSIKFINGAIGARRFQTVQTREDLSKGSCLQMQNGLYPAHRRLILIPSS
eukprot:2805800-Prorocentrum_lima.AAC.1